MIPVKPSKIVCIGRNYLAHARELGNELPPEPLIFLKPPSALLAPEGTILLPPQSQQVEYEGEIGVVVLERLSHVSVEAAGQARLGFTCVNDVTARDVQKSDGQWSRAKGFGALSQGSYPTVISASHDQFFALHMRIGILRNINKAVSCGDCETRLIALPNGSIRDRNNVLESRTSGALWISGSHPDRATYGQVGPPLGAPFSEGI